MRWDPDGMARGQTGRAKRTAVSAFAEGEQRREIEQAFEFARRGRKSLRENPERPKGNK